jgi:outer membrane immunogenic protein
MRKLLTSVLAAAAFSFGGSGLIFAADMPLKAPLVPVSIWTGFYVGGTAGAAWGTFDPSTSTSALPGGEFAPSSLVAFNAAGSSLSIKPSGFSGGFEAGYNWQPGNLVFGVEGDIEWLPLRGSTTTGPIVYPCCAPSTFTLSASASANWLATARARVGFAAGSWLLFATGGAAFTSLQGNFSFSETFYGAAPEIASISEGKVGYTVGGGIEGKLWDHWSVKAEYLYVDFGSISTTGVYGTGVIIPPQPFSHSFDLKADIARLGLNYHF